MVRIAAATMACLATLGMALKAPLDGFDIVDIIWEVDVWGNGTMVNLTGPVQNVYIHLLDLNPDLVKDVNQTAWNSSRPGPPDSPPDSPPTIKRDQFEFGPVCGDNGYDWKPAGSWWIEEGIEYLRKVPGKPVNKPGPRACGRVSCSWNSAIWWCNDKKVEATLPSFNTIADCAQVLDWDCYYSAFKVLGQNFNAGDWTCITRWEDDNC
ncbi:hypothetical protein V8F20_001877 [Naviculisporaceae sp. PSN 640]